MRKLRSYWPDVLSSLNLAYPVMLSQLGHVMMGVVDNVMVGHIGSTQLAAAGLANVAFSVFMLFGIGMSYAITPLVAEADGQKNLIDVHKTLKHGLAINFAASILLFIIIYFGKYLLYVIDQPSEVVTLSIPYLEIVGSSIIPILIFQSFRQFSEGLSNTMAPMIVVLGSNVLNIVLNYVLINGHAGFPAMGLNGAGWATLISRIAMALSIALYVYFSKTFRPYRPAFSFGNYSWPLISRMLNLGIPAGVQFIFEAAAFDFSLVMTGWIGTASLAAHQIAINLATISYMTTSGLAAAATIRVSNELGRNDPAQMKRAAYVLIGIAMVFMTAWAILFIAGNQLLPLLYVDDPAVIEIAGSLIIIAGLFQLSDGMQVVCIGALRGLQDVKVPSVFIFSAYWLIGLPLGYWLAFKNDMGAVGIWTGLLIGLALTATAMWWRLQLQIKRTTDEMKSKAVTSASTALE